MSFRLVRNTHAHSDSATVAMMAFGLWSIMLLALMHFAGTGLGVATSVLFGIGFLSFGVIFATEDRSFWLLAIPGLASLASIIWISTLVGPGMGILMTALVIFATGLAAVQYRTEQEASWVIIAIASALTYAIFFGGVALAAHHIA